MRVYGSCESCLLVSQVLPQIFPEFHGHRSSEFLEEEVSSLPTIIAHEGKKERRKIMCTYAGIWRQGV